MMPRRAGLAAPTPTDRRTPFPPPCGPSPWSSWPSSWLPFTAQWRQAGAFRPRQRPSTKGVTRRGRRMPPTPLPKLQAPKKLMGHLRRTGLRLTGLRLMGLAPLRAARRVRPAKRRRPIVRQGRKAAPRLLREPSHLQSRRPLPLGPQASRPRNRRRDRAAPKAVRLR